MASKIQIPEAFEPLFSPARYKVYYGGRGGAKSWNAIRVLLLLGCQSKLRILCTRELQNSIADSVHRLIGDQIILLGLQDFYSVTQTSIKGINGTEFLFKGLRHNATEIKSTEGVDICLVEEAELVSENSWDLLVPTIRKEGSEIWVLFNTRFASDPTYKRFIQSPPPGALIKKVGWEDNPFFPDTLRDEMLHCKATNPDKYEHIWGGGFGIRIVGRKVYGNEFRRELHVATESIKPIGKTQIIYGWDNTGLSPAICLSYIDSVGQWRIFKEFCYEDTGIADATEAAIVWCNMNLDKECTFKHIGDPAGKNRDSNKKSPADYIMEKALDYGQRINIEDGIQTFKVRREAVAGRLTKMINGEPALLIDPSCSRIIEGFEGGYAYPEIGDTGIFKEEPVKNEFSHIHDAIQYPATRLFSIAQVETVKYVPPRPYIRPSSTSFMG